MPISEKTVQTYLKIKAMMRSPNSNEAEVAGRKVRSMEAEHPGLLEEAERRIRAAEKSGSEDPLFEFLKRASSKLNEFVETISESIRGATEANNVRITRSTRGQTTFLTLVLPTSTLLRVREMNDFQRAAFHEELLRRMDEEIEALL